MNDYNFTIDNVTDRGGYRPLLWSRILAGHSHRPCKMLEIGSHEGRSAIWFLDHILTHPESILHCVDVWKNAATKGRFNHNIRESCRGDKVFVYHQDSVDYLLECKDKYDLIYVDGDHSFRGVLADAILAWRRLKTGGIMVFDDYRLNRAKPLSERPEYAIDLFMFLAKHEYEILEVGYQVALKKIVE